MDMASMRRDLFQPSFAFTRKERDIPAQVAYPTSIINSALESAYDTRRIKTSNTDFTEFCPKSLTIANQTPNQRKNSRS